MDIAPLIAQVFGLLVENRVSFIFLDHVFNFSILDMFVTILLGWLAIDFINSLLWE